MSFSYTPDAPTDRDRLRALIPDTNASSYVFEDSELDIFLALYGGDVLLGGAQALRTLAANQSRAAIYYQVNGLMVDRRNQGKTLADLADKLEARAEGAPWEMISVLDQAIDDAGRDRSLYGDEVP